MTTDQELLSFAASVLEQQGGLVEQQDHILTALLPKALSKLLELPEEVQIGPGGESLLYGSPLLDRFIELTTHHVPVVYGQLMVPYIKKEGFDQMLDQAFSFGKAIYQLVNREQARTSYLILICHYLALSDERKEGLVQVAVHEGTGAIIANLARLWSTFEQKYYSRENLPAYFEANLDQIVRIGMNNAREQTHIALADFLSNMKRHLHRDVRNTREYYNTLKKEMEHSLDNPNLSEDQKNERTAKIQELPREMDRKIDDLVQKYQVHVKLTGCAALRFVIPVIKLVVELKYRKLHRDIAVIFNPITHTLDPLACERCKISTYEIFPVEQNDEMKLLCQECSQKS